MATGFTTIGHSDRSLEEFLGMLQAAEVGLVVDLRSFPRSRSNPAYNIDRLPGALSPAGIGYRHAPALGGRRPRQPGVAESLNAAWRVQSFHNYADYALGPAFGAAFADLLALGDRERLALMCAEALWWRCHRRIVADYLIFAGQEVEHLMAPGQSEPARPTPAARATEDGKVIYPPA